MVVWLRAGHSALISSLASIFAAAGGADIPGTLYIHGAYPGRIA